MEFGIDVSHFNQVNDWHAVRGNNITFTSVKVTESTDFVDNAASGHASRARNAGIHVGGYHFARRTDVAHQVRHFTDRLRANGLLAAGSLAPMIDMEAQELRGTANQFLANFIRQLRQAAGVRRVLVYANLDWWRTVLRPVEWADHDVHLWIARFNGIPGKPGFAHPKLALHQHTDRGNVPGIPGKVDRDATIAGHTLASLLLGNGSAPPKPGPTHVVKAGETLTSIARRHGTTVEVLVRLNHIADPDVIFPGQVLKLPAA
jgi:GH25 family lysozyme M1 (1,4-beta-N-acetylmuramidase)